MPRQLRILRIISTEEREAAVRAEVAREEVVREEGWEVAAKVVVW